jgi:hypothetical protein
MLFGITTEWCSASDRNRVHLRPDSPKKRKSSKNFFVKLFSFHPPTSERIQRCQRILDAYFPDKAAYLLTTDEFDDAKVRLRLLLGTKKGEESKEEKEPVLQRRTATPTQQPTAEPTPEGKPEE